MAGANVTALPNLGNSSFVTMEDVVERIKLEGDLSRNSGTNSIKSLKETIINLSDISNSLLENILEVLKEQSSLFNKTEQKRSVTEDLLNARAEDASKIVDTSGSIQGTGAFEDIEGGLNMPPADWLGRLILIAFTTWVNDWDDTINAIRNTFKASRLVGGFKLLMSSINMGVESARMASLRIIKDATNPTYLATLTNNIQTRLALFAKNVSSLISTDKTAFGHIIKEFKAIPLVMSEAFRPLSDGIKVLKAEIMPAINRIDDIAARIRGFITGALGPIQDSVGRLIGSLSEFMKVSKIFAPIRFIFSRVFAIILGIFDFFKGFIRGYEEGGLLSGLKEGFLEMIRGMILMPLDAIKSFVSWISGKLGFENVEKMLDSFKITDIFNAFVNDFDTMIAVVANKVIELINSLIAKLPIIGSKLGDNAISFRMNVPDPSAVAISGIKTGAPSTAVSTVSTPEMNSLESAIDIMSPSSSQNISDIVSVDPRAPTGIHVEQGTVVVQGARDAMSSGIIDARSNVNAPTNVVTTTNINRTVNAPVPVMDSQRFVNNLHHKP